MNPFDPKKNPPPPSDPFSWLKQRPIPPPNLFSKFPSKPARLADMFFNLPKKPDVFVSYHHKNDQGWYDRFSTLFGDAYNLFNDTSIGRKIDSDDPIYQSRKIREDHITGSSITVLLIGAETWKRKHVDWEVYSTLEKKHALLGIVLTTRTTNAAGLIIVPARFHENLQSGYAHMVHWSERPADVKAAVDSAKLKAKNTLLIRNGLEQLSYNLR